MPLETLQKQVPKQQTRNDKSYSFVGSFGSGGLVKWLERSETIRGAGPKT